MEINQYTTLTKKKPLKTKPRTRPLPKAKEAHLEALKDFEQSLNVFKIKYEKLFKFESTKHWRFDFLMCAEKTGGFNLVNYRHSSGVYHEQETEDLHRRI